MNIITVTKENALFVRSEFQHLLQRTVTWEHAFVLDHHPVLADYGFKNFPFAYGIRVSPAPPF